MCISILLSQNGLWNRTDDENPSRQNGHLLPYLMSSNSHVRHTWWPQWISTLSKGLSLHIVHVPPCRILCIFILELYFHLEASSSVRGETPNHVTLWIHVRIHKHVHTWIFRSLTCCMSAVTCCMSAVTCCVSVGGRGRLGLSVRVSFSMCGRKPP